MIGNTIIFSYYENDSIDCKEEEKTGLVVDAFTNVHGDRIYKVQIYSDFYVDKKPLYIDISARVLIKIRYFK